DVTASFAIVPAGNSIDPVTHTVTANLTFLNKTDAPLTGRYYARILGLHSDFGKAQAVSERIDLPAGDLAPHAQTAQLQLRFNIADFKALPDTGDAVAMYIRVYLSP